MLNPLICIFATLFLLPCCNQHQTSTPNRLRLTISTEPPSLDPRRSSDTVSIAILSMCFDGLFRRDQNGVISPSIAESFEVSEEGRVYTFYLKKTFWSNSKPVVAQDFERTFKTILSPDFPSEFASDLYVIYNGKEAKEGKVSIDQVGVHALSDSTLRIELASPIPYFLDMIASHSFYPAYHEDMVQTKYLDDKNFICNGPFRLKKWKHNNFIHLEKNPLYHDKQCVRLELIDLFIVENSNTQLSLYESDELDWVGSPLSSLPVDALKATSMRDDFHTYAVCGTYYYIFNTALPPFNNVHLRRALAYAINRQQITDNILQGKQAVATSLIPPAMKEFYQNIFDDADTKRAQEELKIALKELKTLGKIKLSYNTNMGHHIIAQAIQQQWLETLGIDIELENMEWKVFLDHLSSGNFQIARMGGLASFNDPTSFLKDFQYSNTRVNHSKWSDQEFSRLIDLSDRLVSPEQRDATLKQAERILIDQMPIAPIYFYTGAYIKNNKLQDVMISNLGEIDFKYAYKETHE